MAEIVWRPPQSELPWELVAVMVEESETVTQEMWIGLLGSRVLDLLFKVPRADREVALRKAAKDLRTDLVYQDPAFAGETLVEENERLQNLLRVTDDTEWPVTATHNPDSELNEEMTSFLVQDSLEEWINRAAEYLDD